MKRSASIFIAFGILYLINPELFRRGLWKKTSIAQRALSPERYRLYMRLLGLVFILVGLVLLLRG